MNFKNALRDGCFDYNKIFANIKNVMIGIPTEGFFRKEFKSS